MGKGSCKEYSLFRKSAVGTILLNINYVFLSSIFIMINPLEGEEIVGFGKIKLGDVHISSDETKETIHIYGKQCAADVRVRIANDLNNKIIEIVVKINPGSPDCGLTQEEILSAYRDKYGDPKIDQYGTLKWGSGVFTDNLALMVAMYLAEKKSADLQKLKKQVGKRGIRRWYNDEQLSIMYSDYELIIEDIVLDFEKSLREEKEKIRKNLKGI